MSAVSAQNIFFFCQNVPKAVSSDDTIAHVFVARTGENAESAQFMPFFLLITHISMFCDKKYHILTFRQSGSLWRSLALSGSLWLALRLSLDPSGSPWLSQALSGSLLLSEFAYKVLAWLTRPLLSSTLLDILQVCAKVSSSFGNLLNQHCSTFLFWPFSHWNPQPSKGLVSQARAL